MHVVLNVLASTSIKRRKPWPRLTWIGEEKQNLLLLGNRRISILYLPSGKTKRKINKLSAYIKDCVSFTYTDDGRYLIGLLSTGNIFFWCKDSEIVSHIHGLIDLQSRSQSDYKWSPKLFSSNDCKKILVIVTTKLTTEIYLYQCKQDESTCAAEGTESWWRCGTDLEITPLRSRASKNLAMDVRFLTDSILGASCFVAFVYSSEASIQLVTLKISWFPNCSHPLHRWHKMAIPITQISKNASTVMKKGAYVARWSHDGRLLAVVINQETLEADKVVFISPHCQVLLVCTLPIEYAGLRHHRWVCDLAWTHNDLFVVTINHLGSICLLSRLGEPLSIATTGCSMDLPAARCLNIHPFIFVRSPNVLANDTSTATVDILKQRFSVCCHPSLPIFLCSDGYMVTCLQLPSALSNPFRFLDSCFRQEEKYLRMLRKCLRLAGMTLDWTDDNSFFTSSLRNSTIRLCDFEALHESGLESWEMPAKYEEPSESDSSNLKSEQILHHYSTVGNHDSGRLIFGARGDNGSQCASSKKVLSLHDLLSETKSETGTFMLSIWGILFTTNETWTKEWEDLAKRASELLVKVCTAILSTCHLHTDTKQVACVGLSSFMDVITLIVDHMNLCRFSSMHKAIMPIMFDTVQILIYRLLKFVKKMPMHSHPVHLTSMLQLVETTERIFLDIFCSFSDQLLCTAGYINLTNSCFINGVLATSDKSSKLLLKKRFTPIWIMLYATVVKLVKNCTEYEENYIALLGMIQYKLQKRGILLDQEKSTPNVHKAEKIMINDSCKYEIATELWKKRIEASLEGTDALSLKASTRLLHSILYALLGGYHLKDSISLIYWLLTRDTTYKIDGCLRHPAIRLTIRSFARFLAAYFINKELHVYPFHCPRYLPSPHRNRSSLISGRIIQMNRVTLTQRLSAECVAYHWTPEVTVALFLSSGFIEEAARFVLELRDWKSAFALFYASLIVTKSKKVESKLQASLASQLCHVIDLNCTSRTAFNPASQRLMSTFQGCFLAGALCNIDVVTCVLEHQIHGLHCLVRQMTLLVPTDIYLPYPPPYCPQPNEQGKIKPADSYEANFRNRIAHLVQLFIVILQTIHCTVYFIDVYIAYLSEITIKMTQVKHMANEDWPLQDLFSRLKEKRSAFQVLGPEQRQKLTALAVHFRNFCAICWFLHVRDKMNMHLRKFWQQLCKKNTSVPAKFCLSTLQYAMHLLPFAESVGWNLDIYHLIVSVLLEAPRDRRSSLILAQCFPEMSQIPTELDYRIRNLLNVWRNTVVKMPSNRRQLRTTKTLSIIHLSQCDGVKQTLAQQKDILGEFDNGLFTSEQINPLSSWKARSFEIEKEYYCFLALMFDVGIIKDNLEEVPFQTQLPILNLFQDQLGQEYLKKPLFGDDSFDGANRNGLATRRITVDAATFNGIDIQTSYAKTEKSNSNMAGLFRSLSLTELTEKHRMEIGSNSLCGRVKSLSNLDKESDRRKINKNKLSAKDESLPKTSSLLHLCDTIDIGKQTLKRTPDCDKMINVLAWLIKWTRQEHFIGNSIEANTETLPRMKIQITFNQIISAIQQAANIFAKTSCVDTKLNTEKPLVMSAMPPSKSVSLHQVSALSRKQVQKKDQEMPSNISDSIPNVLTPQLNAFDRFPMQDVSHSVTSDNSFSSLEMDLLSEITSRNEDLTSVTTSRWTNSIQLPQRASSDNSNKQPPTLPLSSTLLIQGVGCGVELPSIPHAIPPATPLCTPEPVASLTKDFSCGDASIWGTALVDTCIQVHGESLEEMLDQPARFNRRSVTDDDDHLSTTDDTQNDAVSLPNTTSASIGEAVSRQRNVRATTARDIKRHGVSLFQQTGLIKQEIIVNDSNFPDFTNIRLLRLPAERESCTIVGPPSSVKKISFELPSNTIPRVPALLQLERECKILNKASKKDVPQPKMRSHEEIRESINVIQKSKELGRTVIEESSTKCIVPLLLHFDSFKKPIPLHEAVGEISLPKTREVSLPKKSVVHSRSIQTESAIIQATVTTSSQTPFISKKHASTLVKEHKALLHVSTGTDDLRRLTSVGINTSQPELLTTNIDKSANMSSKNRETSVVEEATLITQATQTDKVNNENLKSAHLKADKALPRDDKLDETDSGLVNIDQHGRLSERKPEVLRDVVEDWTDKCASSTERSLLSKISSASEKANYMMVDTKKMKERLDHLKNEGILNESTPPLQLKNFQLKDRKILPHKTHVKAMETSTEEFFQEDKPDIKEELLTWMKSKKDKQQMEFKRQRDTLRQYEKEPYTSTHKPVSTVSIVKAEKERQERQKQMRLNNYEARKIAAKQLMQELTQDEVKFSRKTIRRKRFHPVTTQSSHPASQGVPGSSRLSKDDPSATYILSRGLIPLKGKAVCPQSLPASPSRKIEPMSPSSCPTSPKFIATRPQPTTYIERLQALQPQRPKMSGKTANESQSQINEGAYIKDLLESSSDSSCDTLTPWIVPDDVQLLLFGQVFQNDETDEANGETKKSSAPDSSIDWEEMNKLIELHHTR